MQVTALQSVYWFHDFSLQLPCSPTLSPFCSSWSNFGSLTQMPTGARQVGICMVGVTAGLAQRQQSFWQPWGMRSLCWQNFRFFKRSWESRFDIIFKCWNLIKNLTKTVFGLISHNQTQGGWVALSFSFSSPSCPGVAHSSLPLLSWGFSQLS